MLEKELDNFGFVEEKRMIDGHIHIERGDYTLEWIHQFVDRAVATGLDEIRLLEHNYMFKEFEQCMTQCVQTPIL